MREKMRHAASFPRKRTSVKLRERFRVDGRGKPIRVIEVQVPYWTVDSLELVKGDMLRVHVEDGKRIVFEPDGKHEEK